MLTNMLDVLGSLSGASFMAIDTEVVVPLTGGRKNPMKDRVTKRTTGSRVQVFQNKKINGYDAMVKRRLEAEGKDPGSFVIGPRVWGERIPLMPVVVHNSECYLEVIFLQAGTTEYFLDGKSIDKKDIIGLKESGAGGEQGGLSEEAKVVIRTYKFDSIRQIRHDHQVWNGPFFYEEE